MDLLSKHRANPWKIGDQVFACSPPLVMGIVNVTPDSFFDGSCRNDCESTFTHAMELVEQGAKIIDIGGESSRPGSTPVTEYEEMNRVLPVIEKLATHTKEKDFFISIDTVKSNVAKEAIRLGAHIINDISACSIDPNMPQVVADTRASVVLNHIRGNFGTMQEDFKPYKDVIFEIKNELLLQVQKLLNLGVEPQKICLDPGIGFGKTPQNNLQLIAGIEEFLDLNYATLLGASRKSFIKEIKGLLDSDRLIPTVVSGVVAALGGISCIRVHDVKEAQESMLFMEAFKNGSI